MQRANQRKIQMKRITKIIIPLVILFSGFWNNEASLKPA